MTIRRRSPLSVIPLSLPSPHPLFCLSLSPSVLSPRRVPLIRLPPSCDLAALLFPLLVSLRSNRLRREMGGVERFFSLRKEGSMTCVDAAALLFLSLSLSLSETFSLGQIASPLPCSRPRSSLPPSLRLSLFWVLCTPSSSSLSSCLHPPPLLLSPALFLSSSGTASGQSLLSFHLLFPPVLSPSVTVT